LNALRRLSEANMGTLAFLSAMLWPTDRRLSMEVAEAPLQLSLPFIAPGFQALGCCITTAIAVERGSAIWHLQAWYGRLVSRGRVPIIFVLVQGRSQGTWAPASVLFCHQCPLTDSFSRSPSRNYPTRGHFSLGCHPRP
jgi:hypothetical protein